MGPAQFDVAVVGAGCAGLSAAIGLAKSGFSVVVLEAAAFPGAENWSGCVYFCENLAHPSLLGPKGVEEVAWERRVVERGTFLSDGHSLLGMTYRDPDAFRHCYTVLRPIYDHHLAQVALQHGVTLLNNTTAESLIRDGRRVIGVATQRRPVYADVTFLAEGDASHLVTREGYETVRDRQPKFLHGVKQVIDMPPGAIERNFGLGAEEGAAYEIILRNGTLHGKPVHLNMGGFIYTNRQSLSIGLVLPADHLHEHFDGDPNLLMEWFENLPDVRRWCEGGSRGVFGAKLIRGGGAKEIPRLIDHGLAIGGAASGIGIDLPYPNFTGPATRMGLQLVEAVKFIRAEDGTFTEQELRRHYLEPLKQTRYWKDVEYLRDWPGYVEKTRFFFNQNVELALGSARVWTRPNRGFVGKWNDWIQLVRNLAGPSQWKAIRDDALHLKQALKIDEVVGRPSIPRILIDGFANALRDIFRRPRRDVPAAGQVRVWYRIDGREDGMVPPPRVVRRWFRRTAPILAGAARHVYTNDETPLKEKLQRAVQLLSRQLNLFDVALVGMAGMAAATWAALAAVWNKLFRRSSTTAAATADAADSTAADRASDLTPWLAPAAQKWEDRLGRLAYESDKRSHIHLLWPQSLERERDIVKAGLWHVCPAHVYEARVSPLGQLQLVVNFGNCIKCETCWRTSDVVDWGRDGRHRFIYPVSSPAVAGLLSSRETAGAAVPIPPRLLEDDEATASDSGNGKATRSTARALQAIRSLDRKLEELETELGREPRMIDRPRAAHLRMIVEYAVNLGELLSIEIEPDFAEAERANTIVADIQRKLKEMAEQARAQKFSWAAATGRHLRQHHLAILNGELARSASHPRQSDERRDEWPGPENVSSESRLWIEAMIQRLDEALPPYFWRELEHGKSLSPMQDELLLILAAEARLGGDVERWKALLAELGRRDPSLAFRMASHGWARHFHGELEGWTAFVVADDAVIKNGTLAAELLYVPDAEHTVVLHNDWLLVLPRETAGVRREPLPTLGLRGAQLQRIEINVMETPPEAKRVDREKVLSDWHQRSAADLTAISFGMADQLTKRAVAHATSRVQFPGLFHDEHARDAVGKFGAVKHMIAEIGARRYLLETLTECIDSADLSAESHTRASLLKAVAADALGCVPGSVAYNAGQVFGGTAFSEDDILSKYYRDAAAWRFLGRENPVIWREHGRVLLDQPDRWTAFPAEADRFDEIAQRGALVPELERLRELRKRMRAVVSEWPRDRSAFDEVEFAESLARQDALLLAGKALLLRTHALMERSRATEEHVALLRVWLDFVQQGVDEFEDCRHLDCSHHAPCDGIPHAEREVNSSVYEDFLKTPGEYSSGEFLHKPVDPAAPRYLPEWVEIDPRLRESDRRARESITAHFAPRSDGEVYERYVERRHGPDAADLDFLREHGMFRVVIPKELDGEGRWKAEYYLTTNNAQRHGDYSISLTIQVNTSLGTTPILIARDKDLPKARKELAPFVGDPSLQTEMGNQLNALTAMLESADPSTLQKSFLALQKRLDESVFSRGVLKALGHHFVEAWNHAGKAGKAMDLPTFRIKAREAAVAWKTLCMQAPAYLDELNRRQEACDLCLRWISSGQISAFALTEPSAGSDTARVATRAKLRSVAVEAEPDGVLQFTPADAKEPRFMLDARKLDFRSDGVHYRWSAEGQSSRINFDDYDYETDDRTKTLYYHHGDRRIPFTDISQLRERDGKLWYDYWEMTGAKMWITNGRMCGLMAIYAKTPEGVTGFWVDRHAEGLVIGKDEEKMGQCGSPTNEISLQNVRVPRENVLGLEGRGQVNALDTLNIGRAGLSMSAMTYMRDLVDRSREFVADAKLDKEAREAVEWRLERMAEDTFAAEAVAFEVIGRFEHRQTKSVRMESAIAKFLVSELLHGVIDLSEEVHGLRGQTQLHLVEKRRRDSRVLNIYEGTNEIQRFLILRELISEVAKEGNRHQASGNSESQHAKKLEKLLEEFRTRLQTAVKQFGQRLWQNPNLQPTCFLLSEAAAWLKAMDAVAARIFWLRRRSESADADKIRWGERAFVRYAGEVRRRLRRFDHDWQRLQEGYYATVIRAAELMYDAAAHSPYPARRFRSRIEMQLSVLVVVEPMANRSPRPYVLDGRLLEPYLALTEGDKAALETALRLRDDGGGQVRITVAAVGGLALVPLFREVRALGIDDTMLLHAPTSDVAPGNAAEALAHMMRSERRSFDLILGPAAVGDGEEGLVALILASSLGIAPVGPAAGLAVHSNSARAELLLIPADGGSPKTRALPAMAAIQPGLPLREFTTDDYFRTLQQPVAVVPWPGILAVQPFDWVSVSTGEPRADAEVAQSLRPPDAAEWMLGELGITTSALGQPSQSERPIEDVSQPALLTEYGSLAVVCANADGSLKAEALMAARAIAAQDRPAVMAIVPESEEAQQRVARQLADAGVGFIFLVPVCEAALASHEIRGRMLAQELPQSFASLIIGEPWAESAFSQLGNSDGGKSRTALRVKRLIVTDTGLEVETARGNGRLRTRQIPNRFHKGELWITLAEGAELEIGSPSKPNPNPTIQRWRPKLDSFFAHSDLQRLMAELKEEAGIARLSDADFILDVGYGVGNRDGYEEVILPLEQALRELGVRHVAVGGSRKVTEELHILPVDRQIGQSGVSVNPQILLAIGVSGAPQHLNYIGPRATVLAFNRDAEAPIMTLNQRQPRPRIFPIVGDLFETVPAFVAALRHERNGDQPSAVAVE